MTHVILTHSHFDHAGGIAALLWPGTTVIAQDGFPAELERQHANFVPFGYFTGDGAGFGRGQAADPPAIAVDRLVSEPTAVTIGGTELVLYPASGGETSDALMIYLPTSGVLFTGDVMTLPALRDVESGIRSWCRSPLRTMLEAAAGGGCADAAGEDACRADPRGRHPLPTVPVAA